jgi:hypothetical protein
MSTRLEQFIRDHREEFDGEDPSAKVWDKIHAQLEPGIKKEGALVRIGFLRWTAAAAVLILAVAGIWYATRFHPGKEKAEYAQKGIQPEANKGKTNELPITEPDSTLSHPAEPHDQVAEQATKKTDPGTGEVENNSEINEEMYHYAKLVELKQKELKKIEKDEPLLYKQFAGDVNKLDSVYRSLQKQLDVNTNREQLLEAMIQNLQLQMGLLNHQLEIIKQINHSKKSAYEKAYKSA